MAHVPKTKSRRGRPTRFTNVAVIPDAILKGIRGGSLSERRSPVGFPSQPRPRETFYAKLHSRSSEFGAGIPVVFLHVHRSGVRQKHLPLLPPFNRQLHHAIYRLGKYPSPFSLLIYISSPPGPTRRMTLNYRAKNYLCCALSKEEFYRVSTCKSAKEMWDKLKITYGGTDKARLGLLDLVRKLGFALEKNQTLQARSGDFGVPSSKPHRLGGALIIGEASLTPEIDLHQQKDRIREEFVQLIGLAEESVFDPIKPIVDFIQGKQELDGKLVAVKILSWWQHRVLLTMVGGNPLAAKFFSFLRNDEILEVDKYHWLGWKGLLRVLRS
ncbi:hypothetical protein Taro_012303 [Colocasia esculenta]|uniref:Uncharacterized protein n=1 Tax=Colocasia esculenta TaxID=4460 RepID=A0A843U8Q6_COLES|nr:hypothetical protein [Colocasia esculenta]